MNKTSTTAAERTTNPPGRPPSTYALVSPKGKLYRGVNVARFCDKHDLHPPAISRLQRGTQRLHRGWRVATVEEIETDDLIRDL